MSIVVRHGTKPQHTSARVFPGDTAVSHPHTHFVRSAHEVVVASSRRANPLVVDVALECFEKKETKQNLIN